MITPELEKFFNHDDLASFVWDNKYRFGNEITPNDTFRRHAIEIGSVEHRRLCFLTKEDITGLSNYGCTRYSKLLSKDKQYVEDYVFNLCNFDTLNLGGSMQQGIGNHAFYSSLSNCFVVGQPYDSYSGINKKADEIANLMKRRGGCGLDLSTIRPCGAPVHNQSGWSSGPVLFAKKYSDTTLEVAQFGRRGALMLSCHINHPNSLDFVREKQDKSKLTGANVSLIISDAFMEAVETRKDYIQHFPTNLDISEFDFNSDELEYDKLYQLEDGKYIQKINAEKVWTEIILMAWTSAEPGLLFEGNWKRGGTDYCYPQYRPVSTNPCSEIPMQPYDACRLIAANMFTFVIEPFTKNAKINWKLVYDTFYEQIIIGDILVDLEFEYLDRIIDKIQSGKDPQELKDTEIDLWVKVKDTASRGRRIGAGFLGQGDMLAALGENYYSPEIIKQIFKLKLKAELDATTDLAILYGAFDGFDPKLEDSYGNVFFEMLKKDFPEEWEKMQKYGRRNVSWSTGAPTGTGSLMSQVTSGIEPLFSPYYKRRKKCISANERVDYIDPGDGQKFTEYMVMHSKFIDWFIIYNESIKSHAESKKYLENLSEQELNEIFEFSPWFNNTANDLNWNERVEIQSLVQQYTTHAISSTINLPKDCEKALIGKIYMESWKAGLKGNTIYRDGSRGGILTTSKTESPLENWKRPYRLPADYHTIKYRNRTYSIIIGLNDGKPYEIFIVSGVPNLPENLFEDEDKITGYLVKEDKNWYNFESDTFLLKDIPDTENEEKLLSLMLSGMLSSNKPLIKIIKILDKSKPIAGSFTHRLIKVISKYVPNGEESGEVCPVCGKKLRYEGGCSICMNCGHTKC